MRSLVPIALFTSAEKTQSKSKFRRFVMVLLGFLCKRTLLLLVFHQELYFICCYLRVSAVFPQFCEGRSSFTRVDQLQSEQIFHYIHVCEPGSLFLRKHVLGLFSHVFIFIFSLLWALK